MERKQEKPFEAMDQFGFWFGDMAGSFVNLYFAGFFAVLHLCVKSESHFYGFYVFGRAFI